MELQIMSSSSSQDSGEPRGLLYVLLAAFAIFSGWSLSKLNTPSKEGSKPVTLTDYTQEEHTPCRFDPSLIQPITQTSKQGDYTEEHKRSTPLWEQTMTGAVAVGTIGLLIVNVFALHSAKEAANST